MYVATAPDLKTPLVVTIMVLSELQERPPDETVALARYTVPIWSDGPESLDGEPTWEDAAWY